MNTEFQGYNMVTAVQSAFRQYACFSGRATRSEYWWFQVFGLIVTIATQAIGIELAAATELLVLFNIVTSFVSLVLFLPGLAVLVRRLHDMGKSGLNILWGLLPLAGPVILIVYCCQDSQYNNEYGPSEKYPD